MPIRFAMGARVSEDYLQRGLNKFIGFTRYAYKRRMKRNVSSIILIKGEKAYTD